MATSLIWDAPSSLLTANAKSFYVPIFLAWVLAIPVLIFLKPGKKALENITAKDGLGVVGLTWITISLWGALPFLLSGHVANYTDAVFETVSGFTTTGASIFTNVESLPRDILFWRSLTHWLGGLGIVTLFVALFPAIGTTSTKLYNLEATGLGNDKSHPRIKDTAIILWKIYFMLTVLSIGILYFMGMPLFDSFCHTFGAIATGGFSTKNASIGAYGPSIQWAIIMMMILGGINFTMYYFLISRNSKRLFKDEELRVYMIMLAVATVFVAIILNLNQTTGSPLRDAAFQVVSLMTATGYATADFDLWPYSAKSLFLILMFIGGCAGSTSGGLKVIRLLLSFKSAVRSVMVTIYQNLVSPIRYNGSAISESLNVSVMVYFIIYLFLWVGGTLLLLITESCDIVTALSAAIASLSSVGPGLGAVGPAENYAWMSVAGKWVLIFLMLTGRLEVYAIMALLMPSMWKK